MSFQDSLTRIAAIQAQMQTITPRPVTVQPATPSVDFSSLLSQANLGQTAGVPSLAAAAPASGAGLRILAGAQAELAQGVSEQPPGSNDSPDIARYRSATAGAQAGQPWCAYFVSYLARQVGTPLGDSGQGFGSVDELSAWAQRTGRWVPNGTSQPQPGDLVVFHEHVGVVESVNPDGSLTTIEGNYANRVSRVQRGAGEPVGFVRL